MSTTSLTSSGSLRQVPRRISGSVDQLPTTASNGSAINLASNGDINAIELKRVSLIEP